MYIDLKIYNPSVMCTLRSSLLRSLHGQIAARCMTVLPFSPRPYWSKLTVRRAPSFLLKKHHESFKLTLYLHPHVNDSLLLALLLPAGWPVRTKTAKMVAAKKTVSARVDAGLHVEAAC